MRLTPLFDGRHGIRGLIHVEISEPPKEMENSECETQNGPIPEPSAQIQNPKSQIQNPALEHPVSSNQQPASSNEHPACHAEAAAEGGSRITDHSSDSPSTVNSNDHQPILDFIASDATLDRYGEVIDASGWRLENYRRNPVFQNAHQYGDVIFTLGRALITEVRAGARSVGAKSVTGPALFQRIQFATGVNPMARIAYGLYKGKFLNAVSVGFIPLRWENGDGKQYRRKYLEQELLEVSAVAIPANPNALALGLKSGAVEKSDLRELADLVRLALEPLAAPSALLGAANGVSAAAREPQAIVQSRSAYEAQLLQLARALKAVLRAA